MTDLFLYIPESILQCLSRAPHSVESRIGLFLIIKEYYEHVVNRKEARISLRS